jgi:hypothetical protein
MNNWLDFDIDKTIRDFDYTKRAAARMNAVIDSKDFEDMDADMIFKYLSEQMNIVLFPDYLKRYIYQKVGIDLPFSSVPDSEYADIISSSFEYNEAPYSFVPTSTRKSVIIKSWLSISTVKRSTIFILGFGLRMSGTDLTEFLTKVIQEDDINFLNAEEVIYWHCFENSLPYSKARALLKKYETIEPDFGSQKKWEAISADPKMFLISEENLISYLAMLKGRNSSDNKNQAAYEEFDRMYEKCRGIIADMYNEDSKYIDDDRLYTADDIKPGDIEKVIFSGVPVNKSGNLLKMSASRFNELFRSKRMGRQRISAILNREYNVDRYDLITLLFFIYAETVEPDWPAERYLKFIDEINAVLEKCGMYGIYPVNPYEAFVLMCLVTDFPMDVYAEIWEKSYE